MKTIAQAKDADRNREDDADEGIRTGQSFLNIGEPTVVISKGGLDDEDISELTRVLSRENSCCGDVWRDGDDIVQQGTVSELKVAFICAQVWCLASSYTNQKAVRTIRDAFCREKE